MKFRTNDLYERRYRSNTVIMILERHDTHLVVAHKRETYRATPFVVDGVEHITLPCGTFDAESLAGVERITLRFAIFDTAGLA